MIMFNDVNENSRTVLHSSFIIMPCLNRVCVCRHKAATYFDGGFYV